MENILIKLKSSLVFSSYKNVLIEQLLHIKKLGTRKCEYLYKVPHLRKKACRLLFKEIHSLEIEDFKNKYVFVTGCDTGFGNLLCKKLDRKGFRVLAGCLTEKGADDLKECRALSELSCDPVNKHSIMFSLFCLFICFVGLWVFGGFPQHTESKLNGVIAMTMTFLPLIKQARGRIVNVASVLGRVAAMMRFCYCYEKAHTEHIWFQERHPLLWIKVCIVEPGFFKTAVTSLEPIERELHRLWNQLSPEVKASYGDKYLDNRLIMNAVCDSDLTKVTNCMEHALSAAYPRTRYSAGWDAKLCLDPPLLHAFLCS
uniref:Retinol dehydrogenase 5 (11-cis/9-cis) n=1 Tax=Maylandia zebra TaxID=106582 RepID=A0A3P9B8U4_9CICH